ncbi:class I SAM-dependent methyltransferase [Nitrincola alkalilacustris]|uniref:class I SAM-dependent methyltransferase n=1 Tax=Nitrincola alkalilacustris TaxID=1571224 RepID=UPI00124D5C18|nr:methyltransferase domain-containing protein [Nitrincola alkalilacustris]
MSFSYDEHARGCNPDDLLVQICRTHQGEPVSQEQINLIIDAIKTGLSLDEGDRVLEVACGNGSLSHYLFADCKGYLGFDISDFLIEVARKNFQREPDFIFFPASVMSGLMAASNSYSYNKLLCYAAVQYMSDELLVDKLNFVKTNFPYIKRIFWGNIPDKEQSNKFFKQVVVNESVLNDTTTAIGKWRSQEDIKSIVTESGWNCEFQKMPPNFYASEYRFDAVLTYE